MANKGFPVYQDYGDYEFTDEELAEPDFYVDRYFPDLMDMEEGDMEGGGDMGGVVDIIIMGKLQGPCNRVSNAY